MRLDEASRSLARRDNRVGRGDDGLVLTEPLVDVIARSLAQPMRRRSAIAVVSGTFLAAAAWRPGRAQAVTCEPPDEEPEPCREGGREICRGKGTVCCNIPGCAAAFCRDPWAKCGPGFACDDTPEMCTTYNSIAPDRTKFCSKRVAIKDTCRNTTGVSGWCCHQTMTCGVDAGDCVCLPPGEECGDACCKGFTYCDSGLLSSRYCQEYCGDRTRSRSTWKKRCNGICCSLNETCGFFGCTCKPGFSSVGGNCVDSARDPGDPPSPDNPLRNMLNMLQQSNASHSGSQRRSAGAAAAQLPPPAVVSALNALAAVNAQGAAASLGIRGGKRDSRYRTKVKVARVTPPTVVAGPGLDAGSAAALNKLLVAQAKANALVAAMSTALWRARAARAARQPAAAKTQLRAAAAFATQAGRALEGLLPLRDAAFDALEAGKVAEVIVIADAIEREVAAAKAGGGVPPALKAATAKLGVTTADLQRLRSQVGAAPKVGGDCLIEPLRGGGLVGARGLTQWASRARTHPVAQ